MTYNLKSDSTLSSTNPFEVFKMWFNEVKNNMVDDPSIMTVSTIKDNRPRARTVLLKDFNSEHFTFFTNYESDKAKEIEKNPFAALTFFWKASDYQVRIEGKLTKSPREISEAYFSTRARSSQLASMASTQSKPIVSRKELVNKLNTLTEKLKDTKELKCPENWGGYDLVPDRFIFFIYGEHRLNDRFEFLLKNNKWTIQRLQP